MAPAARTSSRCSRAALVERRAAELERGVTLVGPHRDEWRLRLAGLDSRTHASQGEQRTLALALRLAGHRSVPRSSARSRCCSSTTCSASSTRHAAEALVSSSRRRSDAGHDRVDRPGVGPSRPTAPRARRPGRGGGVTTRRPDRRSDEPRPLRDSLAEVSADLGLPEPDALAVLIEEWESLVGPDVAPHCRLTSLRDGVLARDGRHRSGRHPAALPGRRPRGAGGLVGGRRRRARAARARRLAERPARALNDREITAESAGSGGVVWYNEDNGLGVLTCSFAGFRPLVGANRTPPPNPDQKGAARGVYRQGHHRSQGPRARPRTPWHVHRIDRPVRPAPPRVRGRRQLGRRGDGGRSHQDRRDIARRRRLSRVGQRSWHPGRQPPRVPEQVRGRGHHDHVARGREVRRRRLQDLRRVARRRRVGRQRAVEPPR